jgi:hypothetical protein
MKCPLPSANFDRSYDGSFFQSSLPWANCPGTLGIFFKDWTDSWRALYLTDLCLTLIHQSRKNHTEIFGVTSRQRSEQAMKHFSLEDWADFANNTVGAAKRSLMERHLEVGCAACAGVLARWTHLKSFVAQEGDNYPPEGAVQAVKKAFRSLGPRPAPNSVKVFATLVFDSFQTPALAGVRGAAVGTRRLLYEASGVSIELSVDSLSATGDVLLTGQVVHPGDEATGICEVPVQLLHGRKTIAQTQTNKFGEFHLKGEAGKGMQVSLGVSEQKDVFILLDDSIWRTENRA